MTKFESTIKQIAYPQTAVYARLADLRGLAFVRERATDPAFVEQVRATGKVTDEQIAQLQAAVGRMEFSTDSVSLAGTPLGNVTLQVVERDEPKCVKLEVQGAPIMASVWIQMLPVTDTTSKLKCTIGADLNFLMKQMAKKPLQEAVERLADMLAMVPY